MSIGNEVCGIHDAQISKIWMMKCVRYSQVSQLQSFLKKGGALFEFPPFMGLEMVSIMPREYQQMQSNFKMKG